MTDVGIYCFKSIIDDRIYIGSSKSLDVRRKQHLSELKCNRHRNPKFQSFYNKYGKESLVYQIIENCEIDNLIEREQYYLDLYSNKFNINTKADRPNTERNFDLEKIKQIAEIYNSGKSCCHIAKLLFGSKEKTNLIANIVKGNTYKEYNYLFAPYKPHFNNSFTEEMIYKIADLYNSGKTGCQISEMLFNNRNHRAKINSLIKGSSYSEYNHLFNKREYNQTGRKFSQETKDKIGKANSGSRVLSISDIEFITSNFNKISGRKIAKLLDKTKSTISYYIKNNLK